MDLIYYKSDIGNFGDDLNKWLWPKVFGEDIFNKNDNSCLIGIGSILNNNSNLFNQTKAYEYKYIFGTGVRSLNTNLELDKSYKALFYRGPLSSFKIEKTITNYISDGAYALVLTDYYKKVKLTPKTNKVGFIPYFRSEAKVDWKQLCEDNSWHYISPSSNDVEFTLKEIASCKCIITEAMHGAIIADVFRIPWKRFRFYAHIHETEVVSEFKWNDWLSSIEFEKNNYLSLPYIDLNVFPKRNLKKHFKRKQYLVIKNKFLKKFDENLEFNMSDDKVFDHIIDKLKVVINEFSESVLKSDK